MAPAHVGVAQHDVALGHPADHDRVATDVVPAPAGEHQLGRDQAVGSLDDLGGHAEAAGPSRGPSRIWTSIGPTKVYCSLRACSRAASASSRTSASRKFENRSTSGLARVTAERVRGDQPANSDPPVEVHLPCQSAADLDRLEVASEGLGQRSFHKTLESVLELLESHGLRHPTGRTPNTELRGGVSLVAGWSRRRPPD